MDRPSMIEAAEAKAPQSKPGRFLEIRQRIVDRFKRPPDVDPSSLHPAVLEAPEREVDIINGQEYLRSLSPKDAAYEFTAQDWTEWLVRHVEDVKKESKEVRKNAGALMCEFTGGINDMYESHLSRGNKFPIRPKVSIDFSSLGYRARSSESGIGIEKKHLLDMARQPIDTARAVHSPYTDKQTVSFYGTPLQEMRSTGTHEADHQQQNQTNPDELTYFEQIAPDQMFQSRYDAKPNELRALREQLIHAQRHNYPQATIEVFQNRIAAAEEWQLNDTRHSIIVASADRRD